MGARQAAPNRLARLGLSAFGTAYPGVAPALARDLTTQERAALAETVDRKWYLLDISSAERLERFRGAFPEFAGVTFPAPAAGPNR